jgi:hypothetical protein
LCFCGCRKQREDESSAHGVTLMGVSLHMSLSIILQASC